jgi:hypothetical protein
MAKEFFDEIFRKKREERDGKDLGIDASPLFLALERVRDLPPEERKIVADRIRKASEDDGRRMVDKAIREKVFSKSEWVYLQALGLSYTEMSALLCAYFDSRSKSHVDDNFGVLTAVGSPIWINKDFIKERFGLNVVSSKEALDLAKKTDVKFLR